MTANISNPLDIFFVKIWVTARIIPIKIAKYSIEKIPVLEVIIKNQKDNPAVIASDLNLGEDVCILNRINKSYKTRLC